MRGWRVAFRLAAREAGRHKGRTLLVALLVGLPVAAIVFGASLVRSTTPTDAERQSWALGTADVALITSLDPVAAQDGIDALIARLGENAVVGSHVSDTVFGGAGGAVRGIELRDLPISDPLTSGVRILIQGRAPDTAGEVAVSPAVLRDAGASLGGTLEIIRPRRTLKITGVVIDPSWIDASVGIATSDVVLAGPHTTTMAHLDLPEGAQPSQALREPVGREWGVARVAASEDVGHRIALASVPGGVALVVAAIVAAAALAIGARRQLRILGLLAASGASPDQLRGVMTAAGTVIGTVGATLGLAIAGIALAASAPFVQAWAGHVTDGLEISLRDLIVAGTLGVLAATAAAWFPAFASARIPVLSSLAGRRPVGRVPRWIPITAIVVVVAGTAVMAGVAALPYGDDLWSFVLAGAVAVILGATASAPRVVAALEPLASRLRGTGKLAVRSLVRHRTRAAAVVAAVMAAASLTMAGSVYALARDAEETVLLGEMGVLVGNGFARDQVQIEAWDVPPSVLDPVVAEVTGLLPGSVAARRLTPGIETTEEQGGRRIVYAALPAPVVRRAFGEEAAAEGQVFGSARVSIATDAFIEAIGAPPGTAAAAAEADIVVFAPADAGVARAALVIAAAGEEGRMPVTARFLSTDRRELLGNALIAPERAEAFGFSSWSEEVLVRSPAPLTGAQQGALDRLSRRLMETEERTIAAGGGGIGVYVRYFPPMPSSTQMRVVFLALSMLFTLGVVALGLAIAAADGRAERALLGALGAPPASNRRISVVQSALTAMLGGLLAVPIGFVPTALVIQVQGGTTFPSFPWATAVGLVVIVPLSVALVTSGAARLRGTRAIPAAVLSAD